MNDGTSYGDTSSSSPSPSPAPSDNDYSGGGYSGGYGGGSSKKDDDTPAPTPSFTVSTPAPKNNDNFFGGNTDDVAPAPAPTPAYRRAAPTPAPAPTNDAWGRDQPRTNPGVGREDVPDAPAEQDSQFGTRDITIGGSDGDTRPGVLRTEFPTWEDSDNDIAAQRRQRDAAGYGNRASDRQQARAQRPATDGRYTGRINGSTYGTPPTDYYTARAGSHLRDRMARADAQPSRVTQGYEELPANKDKPFWTPAKKAVAAVAVATAAVGGCMALDHFQEKTDTVPVPELKR